MSETEVRLDGGFLTVSEAEPGNWLCTWLPDWGKGEDGPPNYPGSTFSTANGTLPDELQNVDEIVAWAHTQPWANEQTIG